MNAQEVFDADLARLNAALRQIGAVVEYDDGFTGIDPDKCPESLLSAYQSLTSYGYANGLLP